MSALPSISSDDEYLNEQLINCLNIQTNVIQNLTQFSQNISLQLFEIKNNVNILINRILILEEQQEQRRQLAYLQSLPPPPPFDPFVFYQSLSQSINEQEPTPDKQTSRDAPFIFGPINSNHNINYYDEDEDGDEDEHEPAITFKPIITLAPVEVKTGEEDENILFCERAKLYRYDSQTNQMKERGIGEMKILQHKTKNVCRVLMRRDQVLKICANHIITPTMELKLHHSTENAYIWSAIDYSDGEAKHETLCVRFKTAEQAKKYEKIFNHSKENPGDLPSIATISLNDNDVTLIDEVRPTMEQIERARILQLPLTFYLYENKEPCKGCRGCYEDSSPDEIQYPSAFFPNRTFVNSSLPSLMSIVSPWYSDRADISSSFKQMPSPPKDHRMIIKAKRSLPSNRLPPPPPPPVIQSDYKPNSPEMICEDDIKSAQTHQKKSRNFSGQTINHNNKNTATSESSSVDNYATDMVKNLLEQIKQEHHEQIVSTTDDNNTKPSSSINRGFSFEKSALTTTPSTDFQFTSTSIFKGVPDFNFSDLFKNSSGRDTPLSGASTPDEDEVEPYEPPITFKPIVTLAPVEVKTGEEDENILFCERAKLFRFDSQTNQMKERGIGEMKILQHKTKKVCRILMRRDKILKVCANHKIIPTMELKSHQGSENAYIWSAMDYSDGEAKHETLCVKFKTSDIAKEFFQQFNNAKTEQ